MATTNVKTTSLPKPKSVAERSRSTVPKKKAPHFKSGTDISRIVK